MLAREAHVAPVAEIQIWAKVGSADEGPGEAGLAHFHEHMLFKGTGQRGVGEVAAEIEGEGGRINAYTSFDMTVYHATLPSESLEVGMGVLSDAVRHSVFDPDEVAREIEVVLEEIRRSKDSPHHVLGEALFAEAYRSHPYRAPILGTSESVAGFTQAKLLDFYRRWYTPENLLVVVVGDFETGRAVDLVAKAFESAEPGQARRNRPLEPPQEELRSCILQRSFERASLELGWASAASRGLVPHASARTLLR